MKFLHFPTSNDCAAGPGHPENFGAEICIRHGVADDIHEAVTVAQSDRPEFDPDGNVIYSKVAIDKDANVYVWAPKEEEDRYI